MWPTAATMSLAAWLHSGSNIFIYRYIRNMESITLHAALGQNPIVGKASDHTARVHTLKNNRMIEVGISSADISLRITSALTRVRQ